MSSSISSVDLQQEGSPADLALRGFSPATILGTTGEYIGLKGARIRKQTRGIDRAVYAAAHIRARLGQERIDEVIRQYEDGVPHTELLKLLGLGECRHHGEARLRATFRALNITPKRKKYAPTASFTGLFKEGTAFDLACRGFNQTEVLDATGTDLGGPRSHARDSIRGIDSLAYAVAHVRARVDPERIDGALSGLATDQMTKAQVFKSLGLGLTAMTLECLFTGLNLGEQFRQARHQRQQMKVEAATDQAHSPGSKAKRTASVRARAADPNLRAHDVAKREATMLENYGVKNPLQFPDVRDKIRTTTQERYGYDHHNQRPERREAMQEALVNGRAEKMQAAKDYSPEARAKYGEQMSRWWAVAANRNKALDVKRANGTWSDSNPERHLRGVLIDHFGADDVECQYREDERYPWACDFYIKSRDLFIELNGTWTHQDHWFDPESADDLAVVENWKDKGTPFYLNAIKNWTERDVAKRESARKHRLNYAVFWGGSAVDDAQGWIAAGAPDRWDWQ